ncbi:type II toxin-antitoxin system RelE/ParE family toxin [Cellulomonas sp. Root485]|uniref:type II toxin-antitoxin system RelE family toxin n=1 Tax=Cellulomonas sp. Root485 TaxID=1736546 RepID=UPI001F467171|nr:type II toxin-antitoxin system RelE/ParE family toxin [Cellulomonas sp. Root485]
MSAWSSNATGSRLPVLIAPDDLASLEEAVEILSSRRLMADLASLVRRSSQATPSSAPRCLADELRHSLGIPGPTSGRADLARGGRCRRVEIRHRADRGESSPRRQALLRELAGFWSARCGKYRVIYAIDDEREIVTIDVVDHRRDVF